MEKIDEVMKYVDKSKMTPNADGELICSVKLSDLKKVQCDQYKLSQQLKQSLQQADKEELLNRIKSNGAWCKEIHTGAEDRYIKISKVKELIEQLDEPAPVEVPEFVAEWFKLRENDLEFGIWKFIYDYSDHDKEDKFYRWFNNSDNKPIETLIRMKDGYTVEKEPEWIVKTPKNNYFLVFGDDESTLIDSVPFAAIGDKHLARKFMDKIKAQAVATLIGGEVVSVEDAE